jgi:thiol-disulfide isomerase/thioredoxin
MMKFLLSLVIFLALFSFGCVKNEETKVVDNKQVTANNATVEKKDSSKLEAMPANLMQAQLKTIDGKSFKLEDYKGKVLLVNLWATWCAPCIKEMPEIQRLSDEMKDNFQAVSITNYDEENLEISVKKFLADKKFTYQQGIADENVMNALVKQSKMDAIPVNFVITKDGKIVKTLVGGKKYEEFKAAVEEALTY